MIKMLTEPEYLALNHLIQEIEANNPVSWCRGDFIESEGYSTRALIDLSRESPPLVLAKKMEDYADLTPERSDYFKFQPTAEGRRMHAEVYQQRLDALSFEMRQFRQTLSNLQYGLETIDRWCEYIGSAKSERIKERGRRLALIMIMEDVPYWTISSFLKELVKNHA